jgi:small subunit ribosomal protein S8
MSIDSIGNFLTIIRNGFLTSKRSVVAPYSKIKESIADILKQEGFIKDFEIVQQDTTIKNIKVTLKYVGGESVIHEIVRASRPGRRYYEKAAILNPIKGKFGISIFTTNKGLMTDKRAKELPVGGEVICSVW